MSSDKNACNHSCKSDVISPEALTPLWRGKTFFTVSQLSPGRDAPTTLDISRPAKGSPNDNRMREGHKMVVEDRSERGSQTPPLGEQRALEMK